MEPPFSISELPYHSLPLSLTFSISGSRDTVCLLLLAVISSSYWNVLCFFSVIVCLLDACILHPFENVLGFGRATRFALRAPFVLGASTFKTGR
jgi:hypothetical protein